MTVGNATPDEYRIEYELRDPPPRRVRYTTGAIWLRRVAWNAALALLCLVIYIASGDIDHLTNLMHKGVVAQATITDIYIRDGKNRTPVEDFEFPVADQNPMGGEFEEGTNAATHVGDHFPVTYLPDEVDDYVLGKVDSARINGERTNWYIGIGWGAAVALTALIGLEIYLHNQLALLRDGVAVVGTIISCRKIVQTSSKGDSTIYKLAYSYPIAHRVPWRDEIPISEQQYEWFKDQTQLTILQNPGDYNSSRPYFSITWAKIEGAPLRDANGSVVSNG